MTAPIDLNEVRTFVALFETRSVTACAERLHVTQPTVSYTLAKLRRRFGDDLFTRTRQGVEPSARASAMYLPLSQALHSIDHTIGGEEQFEPSLSNREFNILLSDFGELSFLPLLLARFTHLAPGAWLRARSLVVDDALDELIRGRADLAISSVPIRDDRLVAKPLMTVDYAAIAATDHPRLGAPLISAEAFTHERFVNVYSSSGHLGPIHLVENLGLQSRAELRLTSYSSVPYVIAASELLSILPRHIAEVFARRHSVQVIELPWYVEPIEVKAYFRSTASPAETWFADFCVDTLRGQQLE